MDPLAVTCITQEDYRQDLLNWGEFIRKAKTLLKTGVAKNLERKEKRGRHEKDDEGRVDGPKRQILGN